MTLNTSHGGYCNQNRKPRARVSRRRGKRCTSSSPKEKLFTLPPPPLEISIQKKSSDMMQIPVVKNDLARSRMHLKGVHVLRKNSILVSGLSKSTFSSIKEIQEHFQKRYGRINQCVQAPKGIELKKAEKMTAEHFGGIFITFMNEKSASIAARETNKTAKPGNNVHARFVYSPYCKEFLDGKHCQNLNCVLMHEDVKNQSNSPKSLPSVAKSFKESFRTTPTILRKETLPTKEFSSEPRSFLAATRGTGTVKDDRNDRNESSRFSSEESNDCPSSGFQLIVTPDSTLTKSTCSSRMTDTTNESASTNNDQQPRSLHQTFDEEYVEGQIGQMDLPAKQLFAVKGGSEGTVGVISPPMRGRELQPSYNPPLKMCSTPWDFQSPLQLEMDAFGQTLEKSSTLRTSHVERDNEIICYRPNQLHPFPTTIWPLQGDKWVRNSRNGPMSQPNMIQPPGLLYQNGFRHQHHHHHAMHFQNYYQQPPNNVPLHHPMTIPSISNQGHPQYFQYNRH